MRSGRRNVMNHIASRGPYLVVLSSGCGDFFYHESYCDESGIMTIYGFLNIQILCDVSSGVGLCPYMGNGCVYDLIWERRSFLGRIKLITLYYSSFISYILCLSQARTWIFKAISVLSMSTGPPA
jgi:hypothetical protein